MMKSLTIKIFVTTLSSLILFIAIVIGIVYYYFDTMYEHQIIGNIIDDMNSIAGEYADTGRDEDKLFQLANQFMIENNATMSVTGYVEPELPEYSYASGFYEIYFVDVNGEYYKLFLLEDEYKRTFDKDIEKGSSIQIAGDVGPDGAIVPNIIEEEVYEQRILYTDTDYEVISFNGKGIVTSVSYTDFSELDNMEGEVQSITITSNLDKLEGAESYYQRESHKGVDYFVTYIPGSSIRQVDFYKHITNSDRTVTRMHVNLSLQSINDIATFIESSIPVLSIVIIFLSVIIALLFSRFISKPIVNITKVAHQMASFDFDVKSVTKRSDEIGDLSTSLNTLSSNLSKQENIRKNFVANVSHELKSPISVIRNFTEALEENIAENRREHYFNVIYGEIDRMNRLISEMLTLSKYDAGGYKFIKDEYDFGNMINDIVDAHDNIIQHKSISVNIVGEFNHDAVDKDKIGQVLSNYIVNAFYYCKESTAVTIRGERIGDQLKIEVINKCEPFSDIELDDVWDKFYTRDKSRNKEHSGTGLGLSICRSILEGHGCSYGANAMGDSVNFYFVIGFV